jgi:hypothetical protein
MVFGCRTIFIKLAVSPLSSKIMDAIPYGPSDRITKLCPLILRLSMQSQLLKYYVFFLTAGDGIKPVIRVSD